MKQFKIILGLILFASVTTFAQSPRIKLNQITKDTIKGSVLISNPTDSGMVYSRDFYIAYGADTVLILYGDTLASTSGIISSVLSDGVTITGDGSVGNPLKVDTLLISTIQGLVDTLTARGYLTANQTITLSGDVTGSGTTAITATVVDDSHNHIISNVDFLQDSLTAKANASELSNYVTIAGTETITGAKTFTAALTQSGGDAIFDDSTLVVDATNNRVAIGQTQTLSGAALSLRGGLHIIDPDTTVFADALSYIYPKEQTTNGPNASEFMFFVAGPGSSGNDEGPFFILRGKNFTRFGTQRGAAIVSAATAISSPTGDDGVVRLVTNGGQLKVEYDGDVVMSNNAYINGTTPVTSDFNLKNNINDYNAGLNKIMDLRPVSFYLNNDKDNILNFGFIAQEVQQILPELVRQNNNNGYLYLTYDHFIPILVNATQEQQAIIETQEQKITDLETTIQALITRIENLENK